MSSDLRTLLIRIGISTNKSQTTEIARQLKNIETDLENVGKKANAAKNSLCDAFKVDTEIEPIDLLLNRLADGFQGLEGLIGLFQNTFGSMVNTIDEWTIIEGLVNNVTKDQNESKKSKKKYIKSPAEQDKNTNLQLNSLLRLLVMQLN